MKNTPTFIYVITNPCLVKVETKVLGKSGLVEPVKIGRARDVPKRLGTLNTSMTENFVDRLVVKLENERDAVVLENVVQELLEPLRIYTKDGSSTEFFACPYQYAIAEVKRIAKKLHFGLTEFRHMNFTGRSASAIKSRHAAKVASVSSPSVKDEIESWSNKTQLAKLIAKRGGNIGASGGILQVLGRKRPCKLTSKWRKLLKSIGLSFDQEDKVVDWSKANKSF